MFYGRAHINLNLFLILTHPRQPFGALGACFGVKGLAGRGGESCLTAGMSGRTNRTSYINIRIGCKA